MKVAGSSHGQKHKAGSASRGDATGMKATLIFLAAVAPWLPLAAQNSDPRVISSTAVSPRDGFTRSGTGILFTRDGVPQKVQREVVLENGLRVRPDGAVTLPSGAKTVLGNNQLLTPLGAIEEVALTPQGLAPVTTGGPPLKKHGEETSFSSTDGFTFSGTEVLMTRNGVSTPLTSETRLTDGTRVQPTGMIVRPNGAQLTLGSGKLLGFDGVLRDSPTRLRTLQQPQ